MSTSSVDVMGSNPGTAWIFWTINYCICTCCLQDSKYEAARKVFNATTFFDGVIGLSGGKTWTSASMLEAFSHTTSYSLTLTLSHKHMHVCSLNHTHTNKCAHTLSPTRTHSSTLILSTAYVCIFQLRIMMPGSSDDDRPCTANFNRFIVLALHQNHL